ncbi:MAG: cell shape determination protein CcmA [Firmicutes bacterium HGW-Firmicutes-12]|nr:MAG: cell shape determination protein CcmA [Firmicutes bacterium HGW-Firmicutes-12]
MFGKKSNAEPVNFEKIDTLIGKETVFQGNISAIGTIRIDGEYKGDLKAKGDLVVGDTGKLECTVEARNILVAGFVKGNIQATGRVELASSAKLYGDIKVKNLIIEEGALFKGNCQMETQTDTTNLQASNNKDEKGTVPGTVTSNNENKK